jgi:hypothetical protein
MQPFLAESAPRPGRAIAFLAALAVVASIGIAMTPRHHRFRHHEHHQLPRLGKCVQGYVYLTR